MRLVALLAVCLGCAAVASGCGSNAGAATMPAASSDVAVRSAATSGGGKVLRGVYTRLNGERDDLADYRGRVVLVVNTATQCGFTPQFDGLEKLYRRYKGNGLVLLGFPSNDFAQESRSNKDIAAFCENNFGVSFPMFAKTHVKGSHINPLYSRLVAAQGEPEWNFNKYLVDRKGRVVERYTSSTEPLSGTLVGRIKKLL
jgi:glutathione peroxidase